VNKRDLDSILDLIEGKKGLHPAKRRHKRMYAEPYVDYAKGLVAQSKGNPVIASLGSAAGYGTLGGLLGGLGGHMLDEGQSHKKAMIGALIGSLLGGSVGSYSGYKGQESANSKLNALKRMGIDTPLEQEAMSDYPILVKKLTQEGYKGGYS